MPFEKHLISFSDTKAFSNLVMDYLNDDEKLKPFYSYPDSIEGFLEAIEKRKALPVDRKILAETLKSQYHDLRNTGDFDLSSSQIEKLADENSFTVTCGHQLNIFTGPLYFIYKIFSTINLSEELKKNFPAYNFIPVYWMANEDHDFEEISYVNVSDKIISWQQDQKGASGNILTSTLKPVLAELKLVLGESDNANVNVLADVFPLTHHI